MISKTTLEEKKKEIAGKPWSPVDVVAVNDQVVRLAYAEGEYHWHTHSKEDEMFYLVEGDFTVRMKSYDDVEMQPGDFVVVPKGEEHAPISKNGGYVLMFEPAETVSTGS